LYDARSIRYFVIIPKNGRGRTDARCFPPPRKTRKGPDVLHTSRLLAQND